MPLDLLPDGRNLIVVGTAADSPRLPHARFLPLLIFQQQDARGYYAARLAPPNTPPVGCARLAAVRLIAKCTDMLSLVSDYPHICLLPDLLQQLLLTLLLLSWSAHSHAVRLKIPHPLRTARVPTIELPSRGFSCCCTSQRPQGYHPLFVQLRLHHRKLPTMVVQHPNLQHLRWVAIDPRRTPLVSRARCWSSSQPSPREQGPVPISSPMRLHRSLLFASSRVFVSPVQPALLPGSPRIDSFHVLTIGLPQGRDKEE